MAIVVPAYIAYYQLANVLPVWLQDHANLNAGGFQIPIPWFYSIDPLASILSVPLLFALWNRQARNPGGEPSALSKIANAAHVVPNPEAERNPATAHMFIINPLSGHGVDNLFTTHPATENRIAALQQLAAQMGAQGGTLSVNSRGNYPRRSPWGGTSTSRGPWG